MKAEPMSAVLTMPVRGLPVYFHLIIRVWRYPTGFIPVFGLFTDDFATISRNNNSIFLSECDNQRLLIEEHTGLTSRNSYLRVRIC